MGTRFSEAVSNQKNFPIRPRSTLVFVGTHLLENIIKTICEGVEFHWDSSLSRNRKWWGSPGAKVTAELEGSTYGFTWGCQSPQIYIRLKARQLGLTSDL